MIVFMHTPKAAIDIVKKFMSVIMTIILMTGSVLICCFMSYMAYDSFRSMGSPLPAMSDPQILALAGLFVIFAAASGWVSLYCLGLLCTFRTMSWATLRGSHTSNVVLMARLGALIFVVSTLLFVAFMAFLWVSAEQGWRQAY